MINSRVDGVLKRMTDKELLERAEQLKSISCGQGALAALLLLPLIQWELNRRVEEGI